MSIIKNTQSEDVSLDSILSDFQLYLEHRNMSANTIRAYLYAVRQFHELYEEPSHANLMLYKCYLLEHYKPQTVNLRIRAVNSYMEYLKQPDSKIKMVRIQHKFFIENVISQADYEYLKNCLQRDGQNLYYFAVRLMATTGMRISELLQTTVEDIQNGYIDLYSKGNRIRRVFFTHEVSDSCLRWLMNIGRNTGYVFLNRFGTCISDVGLREQLKQFAYRYGLNPSVVYPHAFRHLFARNFIENCDDIAMLSDILGHESIETTRIYLQRSATEQKQMFNQVVDW
ncbi:MAG: tyrosine-type recombinase/integrase [Lachnospiraceae bacterium]|nr:tyrosine-type recombinase/integrase [Lachnospiraceae bacterium]